MLTFVRAYGVIVYWAVYLGLSYVPLALFRGDRRLTVEEVLDAVPTRRPLLDLWPRIKSGLTILFLLSIVALWLSSDVPSTVTQHAIGSAYGILLLLDALFPWITGCCALPSLKPSFVLISGRSGRLVLTLGLAFAYTGTALALLIVAIR